MLLGPEPRALDDPDKLTQLLTAMNSPRELPEPQVCRVSTRGLEYSFSKDSGLRIESERSFMNCWASSFGLLAAALVFLAWMCWQVFGPGKHPTASVLDLSALTVGIFFLFYLLLRQPKNAPIAFQVTSDYIKAHDKTGHVCTHYWRDFQRLSIMAGSLSFNDGRKLILQFSAFRMFDEMTWDCMVCIAGGSAIELKQEWEAWNSIPEFHSLHNVLILMSLLLVMLVLIFGAILDIHVGVSLYFALFCVVALMLLQKRLRYLGLQVKRRFSCRV